MNAVTQTAAAEPVSGVEIFVALNKLKKSPRNARKVPHGDAAIEALAASIQPKGLIKNLVVEPEVKADGEPTGCYFVTAGEGRRLAMLLRAKRKQIRKTEAVRCWLDTQNDPAEVSLDENVTRTPMHPADQFERFAELSNDKGWGRAGDRRAVRRVGFGGEATPPAWCCQSEAVAGLSRGWPYAGPAYGLRDHRGSCPSGAGVRRAAPQSRAVDNPERHDRRQCSGPGPAPEQNGR